MTNKFLFFNFFLYSSSCRCCCCSILLQCSMQYRVIVVNRARSFPFVCRFFSSLLLLFLSQFPVSFVVRDVYTHLQNGCWCLFDMNSSRLQSQIEKEHKRWRRTKKNSRTYKHEKSYCDSFIECVLLKCMRDVANGTHYNLHRRLACLSNWLQHRTRKREWKGIKEFHVHTHTPTRAYTFRVHRV